MVRNRVLKFEFWLVRTKFVYCLSVCLLLSLSHPSPLTCYPITQSTCNTPFNGWDSFSGTEHPAMNKRSPPPLSVLCALEPVVAGMTLEPAMDGLQNVPCRLIILTTWAFNCLHIWEVIETSGGDSLGGVVHWDRPWDFVAQTHHLPFSHCKTERRCFAASAAILPSCRTLYPLNWEPKQSLFQVDGCQACDPSNKTRGK